MEKLFFASDLHGDGECVSLMLDAFEREGADKLYLLGDIIYHGPRNALPTGYNPKAVISMLNAVSDKILSVRGNCDAEVDGMVLAFDVLTEERELTLCGRRVLLTHGHHTGEENAEGLANGDILITGHTHLHAMKELDGGILYLNPGSVSIPKGGNERTYMIYENGTFTLKTLCGREISSINIIR